MPSKPLTAEGFVIKLIGTAGRRISEEYPQIADDYRGGMNLANIAEGYGFAEKYNLSRGIAPNAVMYALRLLISDEERKKLEIEHKSLGRIRWLRSTRLTYPYWTEGERQRCIRLCMKYRLPGGRLNYGEIRKRLKHRRTNSAVYCIWRRALNKGEVPTIKRTFTREQRIFVTELCRAYQHPSGRHRGRPDYKRVTEACNEKFRTRETRDSIAALCYRMGRNSRKN